jgi:hypothetical protein
MKAHRKVLIVAAIALALLFTALLPAWSMDNESPVTFDIILRLLGLDVGVGYRGLALLPGTDTIFWAYAGGGYEWMTYYRDQYGALLLPGEIGPGGTLDGAATTFVRYEGAWRLGMEQGFAWNERTKTNLFEAFAFYRGRYDVNEASQVPELHDSAVALLPDKEGGLLNTLQAGVAYDDLLFDAKHKTKSGFSAEATAEWGPGFLFNAIVGNADFLRLNAMARGFIPLYDVAPDRAGNLFSVYAGDYISVDYALGFNGAPIPLFVRQTFGGRDQNTGLGHSVRGVDTAGYDTNFKVVNNLEVRANLPALYFSGLVPGIVVFFDAGYYAQVGEGLPEPVPAGFIASTGAGVYIDLFDLASLALYFDYRLDKANADGSQFRAAVIEFGMHF